MLPPRTNVPLALARSTGHWFSAMRVAPAAKPALHQTVRPRSSVPIDAPLETPAVDPPPAAVDAAPAGRLVPTLEVTVSKIFPAGFGWQAASVVAGDAGFEADSLGFALTTGAGDFAGVFLGHTTYSMLKYAVTGKGTGPDAVTGLWLASAAFCSGTAWQPTVCRSP
jgi:hypothetical protein